MVKMYKLLIAVILFSSCQSNEITFEKFESKFDCHMCPGYLVVTKNNLSDTIKTGSWGKVQGVYNVVKIIDKDYVVIESSYFSGSWIERSILVFSTQKDTFLNLVYSKTFLEQEESYEEVDGGSIKLNRVNRSFEFSFKEDTLVVDIDSTLSYLIEPSMDLITIDTGSNLEWYIIK